MTCEAAVTDCPCQYLSGLGHQELDTRGDNAPINHLLRGDPLTCSLPLVRSFDNNTARQFEGGAIWMTSSDTVDSDLGNLYTITNSNFTRNSAGERLTLLCVE